MRRHYDRLPIEFLPDKEKLQEPVRAAFKMFRSALGVGTTKDKVYEVFDVYFRDKLSHWCTGTRSTVKMEVDFTTYLAELLTGKLRPIDVLQWDDYKRILSFIESDPECSREIIKLAKKLDEFKNEIEMRQNSLQREASTNEFLTRMASPALHKLDTGAAAKQGQHQHLEIRIAEFPRHIPQIVALIESATKNIFIQCDCLDYGSFRDFELHKLLLKSLVKAAQVGITIEYLIWQDEQPMSWANRFRKPTERAGLPFRTALEEFCRSIKDEPSISAPLVASVEQRSRDVTVNWADPSGDFLDVLSIQMEYHKSVLKVLADVGIKPVVRNRQAVFAKLGTARDEPPEGPFYWIVDKTQAVFAVPRVGKDAAASLVVNPIRLDDTLTDFYQRVDYLRPSDKT